MVSNIKEEHGFDNKEEHGFINKRKGHCFVIIIKILLL